MARFTFGTFASLTILYVAGAVPLMAQYRPLAPAPSCPCPPGQPPGYPYPSPPPSYQYPNPPSQYYMPAPSGGAMKVPPKPGQMPNAPPSPSRPSDGTQQPSDSTQQPQDGTQPSTQQPQDNQQTPDFNTQAPDMATPTFNPGASSSQPTTAATSAQSNAPNAIGDLFGTAFAGSVPVVVDNFFGFGSLNDPPMTAPDFDVTSPLAYTSTSMTTIYVGRTPDLMSAISSISDTLTGSTVLSQSAIAAADPSLSGPQAIVNNPDVEAAVASVAGSIHGPGATAFVPGSSFMTIDPDLPLTFPTTAVDPDGIWNYDYIIFSEAAGLANPGGAPGAAVGRQKLTENSSPLPHDRVFVNYSYFNNAPLTSAGVNVNRVTPGFEKTFFGGNMSVEVRAPFATTIDSDITAGGLTDTSNAEFGNLTFFMKALLWDAGYEAVSAGLGLALPTADDVTVRTSGGTSLLDIQNESVHLLPFIGGLYMPTEKIFVQGFLQLDVDLNGNPLRFTDFNNNGAPTGNLSHVGRPQDADYLFFDVVMGWWAYEAPVCGPCCCDECSHRGLGCGFIRGVAPIVELHYNTTINDADAVFASQGPSTVRIGDSSRGDFSLWNLTFGLNFECHHNASLVLGYATPINNNQDQQFDSEFRVVFNWFFGGPDRVHSCGLCSF